MQRMSRDRLLQSITADFLLVPFFFVPRVPLGNFEALYSTHKTEKTANNFFESSFIQKLMQFLIFASSKMVKLTLQSLC